MLDSLDQVRIERLVLPHLDAAFNLARWLLRSSADAEDAGQEAMLRAYRFFHGFRVGMCARGCYKSACFTWVEKNRRVKDMIEFDEEFHGPSDPSPEVFAIAADSRDQLAHALESLPPHYRA